MSDKEQQAVKLLKQLGYKIENPLLPIQPRKMTCENGTEVTVTPELVSFNGVDACVSISFEDFEQVNNLWDDLFDEILEREEIEED